MFPHYSFKATCFALFLAPPLMVQAAEESNTLETVVITGERAATQGYQALSSGVAGKTDTPIMDTPATVNVVSEAVLVDQRPESLDEALKSVPGIMQGNTLAGTLDAVVKRGFGDNRDNSIMRNGLQIVQPRIYTPTTERVEVLKGPASVLYGIQDPGGVVNVVSKQPSYTPQYSLETGVGSHRSRQVGLDLSNRIGASNFSYRFIADTRKSNYWRNFGSTQQTVIAPSLAWQNDTTKVLAAYEFMDYRVPFDRGTYIDTTVGSANYGKPVAIPAERRLGEAFDVSEGQSHLAQLSLEHQLNANWKAQVKYSYNRNTYDDWQDRVTAINTLTGKVTRRVDGTRGAIHEVHNLSAGLSGSQKWGSVEHKISVGVEAMDNDRNLRRIYRGSTNTINMYNPVYGLVATPTEDTVPLSTTNNAQRNHLRTASLYAQDAVHLNQNWIVSGGLRLEYYDQLAGREEGGVFIAKTDSHGWKLLPQLGVVYRPSERWSFYGNYSESFRPQSSISDTMDSSWKPEQGRSYEVGAKFEGRRLSASVALFHITKRNVAYSVTDASGNTSTEIAGRVRSQGLELETSGQLNDRWGVRGNYTYTHTKTLEGDVGVVGLPLNGVPLHQAGLWLTYDFGRVGPGQLRAGVGAKYTGEWFIGNTTGGLWRIPSSTVADAFMSYDTVIAGKKVNFRLTGKNLTDRTYYTSTVGSSATLPIIALGNPREVNLSAKIQF